MIPFWKWVFKDHDCSLSIVVWLGSWSRHNWYVIDDLMSPPTVWFDIYACNISIRGTWKVNIAWMQLFKCVYWSLWPMWPWNDMISYHIYWLPSPNSKVIIHKSLQKFSTRKFTFSGRQKPPLKHNDPSITLENSDFCRRKLVFY